MSQLKNGVVQLGGKPKTLPTLANAPENVQKHVTLFRNIDDFKSLEAISRQVKSITIIGGGFLGSELACALGRKGNEIVNQILHSFWRFGEEIIKSFLIFVAGNKILKESWSKSKIQLEKNS